MLWADLRGGTANRLHGVKTVNLIGGPYGQVRSEIGISTAPISRR
jgi:uncharacterized protein YerC